MRSRKPNRINCPNDIIISCNIVYFQSRSYNWFMEVIRHSVFVLIENLSEVAMSFRSSEASV